MEGKTRLKIAEVAAVATAAISLIAVERITTIPFIVSSCDDD
jgi:hypothetical protein